MRVLLDKLQAVPGARVLGKKKVDPKLTVVRQGWALYPKQLQRVVAREMTAAVKR